MKYLVHYGLVFSINVIGNILYTSLQWTMLAFSPHSACLSLVPLGWDWLPFFLPLRLVQGLVGDLRLARLEWSSVSGSLVGGVHVLQRWEVWIRYSRVPIASMRTKPVQERRQRFQSSGAWNMPYICVSQFWERPFPSLFKPVWVGSVGPGTQESSLV